MDINNKQAESNGRRTASTFGDTGKKGNIFLFLITLCKKTMIGHNVFTTTLTKDIIFFFSQIEIGLLLLFAL